MIWQFIPPHFDYVNSSPAVKCGRVYIGDRAGFLWCLDEYTGDTLWSYRANNGIDGGISVDDSLVFFGSMRGNISPPYSIYALDAFTGELVWGIDVGDAMVGGTPAVYDSFVIVGSSEGENNVYCLNKYTGEIVWIFTETNPPGWIESSPCVYEGKVYVGSTSGKVYCLDLLNGTKIWEFTVGQWITSSPGVHNGKIFIGAYDGNVYAIPAIDPDSDGVIEPSEVIWTFPTNDLIGQSSPAIADGKVFIGSYDGKIYTLDEETGELFWSYQTGGAILSSPAVSDGMVFVGSADDTLYVFGEPVDLKEEKSVFHTKYILRIFPDPFSFDTKIEFQVVHPALINLKIYDLSGRYITTLMKEFKDRGVYCIRWVPERKIPIGIYLIHLQAGERSYKNTVIYKK